MPVVDDFAEAVAWIAAGLVRAGYKADFSPASAWEIDRFFDEQMVAPGVPRPNGLLGEQLGPKIFALGAYIGELIRRNSDGWSWVDADGDPEDEINVRLERGRDDTVWPVQRAMSRYRAGAEHAIAAYVAVIAELDIGLR